MHVCVLASVALVTCPVTDIPQKLHKQELGDAVILDADTDTVMSEFDDIASMPSDVVSVNVTVRVQGDKLICNGHTSSDNSCKYCTCFFLGCWLLSYCALRVQIYLCRP